MKNSIKILVIVSLLLAAISARSQGNKWYKITANDFGIIGTQAIAGGFDGWNQNIIHHRWGIGKPFWDNRTSWKRKYKDFDKGDLRPAYLFSKNLLVFTTDGFHMTRMVSRTATLATIAIAAGDFRQYPKNQRLLVIVKKVVLSIIANRVAFAVVYD